MALAWMALLALPAAAEASLSWSAPAAVDPQAAGIAMNRVACPSTTQCTAVDGRGQEVTFNPQAPANPVVVVISSHVLSGVACPTTTQCTAVDVTGQEVTFNPQSSAGGSPMTVDSSGIPLALVCPSSTQCTAVDANGAEDTFNPLAPGPASPQSIDPNHILIAVACPADSPSWCTAVDSSGGAVGFDPQGPLNVQGPTQIDSNSPEAAACATSKCAMVDNAGAAVAFTASSGQAPQGGSTGPIDQTNSGVTPVLGVACPSDSLCVGVDQNGAEETFDPSLPISGPVPVDSGQTLSAVSCPSQNQCTAVDHDGFEVTFNPNSPGKPTPVPVDGHTNLSSVSCPSTSQCTTLDVGGGEATFTPGSATARTTASVDAATSGAYAVSCPSLAQCTAVDGHGQEVTFNPQAPGSPKPTAVDRGQALYGVECPDTRQCTAVDASGREVTFNPQDPGSPSPAWVDSGHALNAIACPGAGQCTAVDDRGAEVTFAPASPGSPRAFAIDRVPASDVTCPLATQCTAVDGAGDEVTFNPLRPSQASALAVDTRSQLAAVACRTPTDCVAVDQAGGIVEGDPRGIEAWSSHGVSKNLLADIACPSARECVAVDAPGNAYLGSSGPLPPVPEGLSSPSAAGLAQQGQTLAVKHGRWSESPTSYTYQWERCTSRGGRCRPIAGADTSTYRLAHADVGHRIRVQETAWNITGAGAPRLSRATEIVGGLVSFRATVSGVSRGAARLEISVRALRGTTRLVRVGVVLPRGLSLSGGPVTVLEATPKRPSYRVTARGRDVSISLRMAAASLEAMIAAPHLVVGRQLEREVRSRRKVKLTFTLSATQRDGGRTVEKLILVPR